MKLIWRVAVPALSAAALILAAACGDAAPAVEPAAARLDRPLLVGPVWTTTGDDQIGAWFGAAVSSAGDVNRDGFDDVIVGAPTFRPGQTEAGKAYVYLGSAGGPASAPLAQRLLRSPRFWRLTKRNIGGMQQPFGNTTWR